MSSDETHFALFDHEEGGALLFTEFRRSIFFSSLDGGTTTNDEVVCDNLDAAFALIEAATGLGEWVVILADYELGSFFEPKLQSDYCGHRVLRAAVFGRVEHLGAAGVAAFLDDRLSRMSAPKRVAGVAELSASLSSAQYVAKVEQVKAWITEGDCYQVNLTFPLAFTVFGEPLALYADLRRRQPVRYGAFIAIPEETILSFSPELFFERRGTRVLTRPMKGTTRRGTSPASDEILRSRLLASEKERAENVMIVDLLRNDLARLAAPGKVRVESLCEAEAYPTLWQMVSSVAAELPDVSLLDLFSVLFPCGSITGAPKIRAMQRIALLEEAKRGLYTGALGWVAPGGDCRFNVAIRTVTVDAVGQAKMGVGSGIVIDSAPLLEYAECLLKAHFLTGRDPGFELIETMRLVSGDIPLLNLHMDRLETSASALGFVCDRSRVQAAVRDQVSARPVGAYCLRLRLAHDGRLALNCTPLPAASSSWRAIVADQLLDRGTYLLRHKTTARSLYDQVLARLPEAVFDAIFLNAQGEVCEGARSNVFVERNGILLTPPLSCGVLPGVMRRHLIESGRAIEQVLTRDDLQDAPALYLANALRGLLRVELVL